MISGSPTANSGPPTANLKTLVILKKAIGEITSDFRSIGEITSDFRLTDLKSLVNLQKSIFSTETKATSQQDSY